MRGAQQPSALVTKTGRVVVSSPPSWLPDRVDVPADTDRFTLTSGVEVAGEALENGEAVMLRKVDRSRPVPPQAKLRVLTLGRRRASLQQIGGTVELSPRHSEILTLLMLHPEGLTGEELALEIYGSNVKSVTIRAEMSRYEGCSVACSWPARTTRRRHRRGLPRGRALLHSGDVAGATRRYVGPLLVRSKVPAIVESRERLEQALRARLLAA